MSLNDYLRKFEGVCDSLSSIGFPLDDKTKVFSLLNGLGARYEPFTTSMQKPPMPNYAEKNNFKSNNKGPRQSDNFSSKGKGFSPVNQATDRVTQRVLMKGLKQDNLYTVRASPVAFFSSGFQAIPRDIWHQRLRHPQAAVVAKLQISVSGTLGPFEKLHVDLRGPAPVTSINKFLYYAAIVDDFTKFIWLIPLKNKSDFFNQFILFEKYVSRQFEKTIKVVQTDGRGEFMSLSFINHL
ncbi:hypothetical protein Pint_33457 [Pistacia integerrima]|uniref:Uncharacterized protein n=1 Tax=Pistacia integerrima TaxID=434235 RepID=A0ACC0X818_9ROSI|nr:hypothetical protein Pint_33457 [Pistacia integerrima]